MKLIHPIYLDVQMLVSFAAALENGLSFTSEVTKNKSSSTDDTSQIGGKFGFSQLFSNLFDISIDAKLGENRKEENKEITKERRSHTEASIAILLYSKLKENTELIEKILVKDDFSKIAPGTLIEVSGRIEKNAVDSVIDYIDAIMILSSLDSNTGKNQMAKSPLAKIRKGLDEDRQRTPISNTVLKCNDPINFNGIVTLRTENLRDLTLSELNNNQVTVVGKVTRILSEEEEINTFENYGMSMVDKETLDEVFGNLKQTEGMVTKFADITIKGPGLQILPLMIFV